MSTSPGSEDNRTRAYQVISECNKFLVRASDEQDLTTGICRIMVTVGGYRAAWVGYAREDENKTVEPVAQSGFEQEYLKDLRICWKKGRHGKGPTGTAIRTGNPVVIHDIPNNPKCGNWIAEAIKRDYSTVAAFPLVIQGQVTGALTIFSSDSGSFDPDEVQLLSELAQDLAFGTVAIRTRIERNQTLEVLEERVKELNCLYEISSLSVGPDISLDEIMKRTVMLLPTAFQFPGIASARIILDGQTSQTAAFRETPWMLSREIIVNCNPVGEVTVCYLEERQESDEGQFIVEERQLLNATAELLSHTITRKKTEESLRDTTEYLQGLIRYANGPIIVWDPLLQIIEFNHAFEVLTGMTRDQVLGKNITILFPETSSAPTMDLIKRTTKGERWESVEIPFRHVSGDIRTVLWNSANILSSDGTPIATIAQGQDITKRKKAELDLEFRNLILSTQLESAIDGLLVVDEDANILLYNQRFCTMWDIPPEIIAERSDQQALQYVVDAILDPEQFLERVTFLYEHKLDTGQDEISLKDGRTFDRYTAPMIGPDKRYYGRVWSFRDITEQKASEKHVLYMNQMLRTIRHINRLLVRERDPDRLLQEVCTIEVKSKGFENAWIVRFDENGAFLNAYVSGPGMGTIFADLEAFLQQGNIPWCLGEALQREGVAPVEKLPQECFKCPFSGVCNGRITLTCPLRYEEDLYGVLSATLPENVVLNIKDMSLFKEACDDVAFGLNTMGLEQREGRALAQIQQNMMQLATLNDEIRNPLSIIRALNDMECNETDRKIIDDQILIIDNLIRRLDTGWLDSEKIWKYLNTHYGIKKPDEGKLV